MDKVLALALARRAVFSSYRARDSASGSIFRNNILHLFENLFDLFCA